MLRERGTRGGIFTRPSKRKETISKQPSERLAFEAAEEWAKEIKRLGLTDRFGMRIEPVGRGYWNVYLIDRSMPEE
jgi:hypothetical protein